MNTKKYVAIRLLILIPLVIIFFTENPILMYIESKIVWYVVPVWLGVIFYTIHSLTKIAEKIVAEKKKKKKKINNVPN